MVLNIDVGKQVVGGKIFNKLLDYWAKDPCNNFSSFIDVLLKTPVASHHRDTMVDLKKRIHEDEALRQYLERMFSNIDPQVRKTIVKNFFVNAILTGVPKQYKNGEQLGVSVPFTILLDPTSKCNLNCTGCWAGAYQRHDSLSFEEVDRIVTEAKELGMYFITMSGGEPFLWPHLFELFEKHPEVVFMTYTNGTKLDKDTVQRMKELGNVSACISLEGMKERTDFRRGSGMYDKIMQAMDNLYEAGIPFGFSATLTRENWREVVSEEFIDHMIDKGALYGFLFLYVPIGKDPDFSLMLTDEERKELITKARSLRDNKPLQFADFWNDSAFTQGCIAGGRRFFHINAKGDVEPCAFVHFGADNIKGKPLKEVLKNPVFKAYQKRQPFTDNALRPCPLIDKPEELRHIVEESGAKPTHEGADAILEGYEAKKMGEIAEAWKAIAENESYREPYEIYSRKVNPDELKELGKKVEKSSN